MTFRPAGEARLDLYTDALILDNGLAAPEWCRGCPDPIYDDRRGEWDWYCRQWSPTGIRCSNVAVLRERCYRVREYFSNREATL